MVFFYHYCRKYNGKVEKRLGDSSWDASGEPMRPTSNTLACMIIAFEIVDDKKKAPLSKGSSRVCEGAGIVFPLRTVFLDVFFRRLLLGYLGFFTFGRFVRRVVYLVLNYASCFVLLEVGQDIDIERHAE